MAAVNAQDLINVANCLGCLTPFQLQLVRTSLLAQILQQTNPMASVDPQSLLNSAKCLDCLTPGQLSLVSTQLLAEILQAGGTGGNGCIVCSQSSDPSTAPDCDCAIAYRRDNGNFWTWNSATANWDKIIG